MRLLSDTQAFLWFSEGSPRLPTSTRALLEDPSNQVLVSMASVWEIAIKVGIGKLTLFSMCRTRSLAHGHQRSLGRDSRTPRRHR